jgi:F-box protein 25/32
MQTHNNINTVKTLLSKTEVALKEGRYDHLGSAKLWQRHQEAVRNMQQDLSNLHIKEVSMTLTIIGSISVLTVLVSLSQREEDGRMMMSDLPDDVIRGILHCLNDHRDVIRTGMTETRAMELAEEKRVWLNLCQFHFENKCWNAVVRKGETMESLGPKKLYSRLVK